MDANTAAVLQKILDIPLAYKKWWGPLSIVAVAILALTQGWLTMAMIGEGVGWTIGLMKAAMAQVGL